MPATFSHRCAVTALLVILTTPAGAEFRAGAAAVDVTPQKLPVSMTGSFHDRKATAVHDPLHARALVLDDGTTRLAFVIVDSALITRDIFNPDAVELRRAHEMLKQAQDPSRLNAEELYAQESIRLSEGPDEVTILLQAVRVGDTAVVAVPCEPFAAIGLEIRKRSPFASTFLISLANGYNGYLPTPEQHELGGYETWRSGWSYLETEASRKITETLVEMLEQLQ